MGNIFQKQLTPEEIKENINVAHEMILSVMNYPNDNLNADQRKAVLNVFRFLMRCHFYESATRGRLYQQVTLHIDDWISVNPDKIIDRNKFIIDTTNKLEQYLGYYRLQLMKNDH